VGSYNLFREHLKVGGRGDRYTWRVSAFRTDQDGFRQHSNFSTTGFDSKFSFTLNDRSRLTAVVAFDRNFQRSPGPLTQEQFDQDIRQADSVFLASGVRSIVEELRFGINYRRELFGQDALDFTGYYIPRHLGPFFQIGVRIPQDFTNRGANLRYLMTRPLFGRENRFTVGVDVQNTPITTGVFSLTNGAGLSETEEHATTAGVYALEEFSPHPDLTLSAGGRFDHVRFSSSQLTRPGSYARRIYENFTPKFGVSYRPAPVVSFYATYSEGFETPIIGELRTLPNGAFGFNDALDPQTLSNYEVGARGALWGQRIGFELALFHQDIKNFISPFGTFPNNSFQNVGKVNEEGIEAGISISVIPAVTLAASYTFSDFVFEEFDNGVSDFSGNQLPGVPRHTFWGELRYRDARGVYGGVELQTVGSFFTNDPNTFSNPPYTVLNARTGYEGLGTGRVRFAPFFGVSNVTDERYSAFALINDARSRFFNPLPGTSAYGGVEVSF
jgi:iron complex outermembrane receptor protein